MDFDTLHPAYFEVRFRGDLLPERWPEQFAVITAYATTGEQWSPEENHTADQRLLEQILKRGLWHVRLTGYSPRDGHAEPGWAVKLSLEESHSLGRMFRQDAIFWISGDGLWVAKCDEQSGPIKIGSFRERLDNVSPS